MGFVRGDKYTGDAQQYQAPIVSGVVIIAPKQTKQDAADAQERPSNVLGIRRLLQQRTSSSRADAPKSPPAARHRRSSPTYDAFRRRASPIHEPLQQCAGQNQPAQTPAAAAAAAAVDTHGKVATKAQNGGSVSRHQQSSRHDNSPRRRSSRSRGGSRSRNRHDRHTHRSRSNSRGKHEDIRPAPECSTHSSHHRSRSKSSSRHRKSCRRHSRYHSCSSSSSRDQKRAKRRSKSRDRGRLQSSSRDGRHSAANRQQYGRRSDAAGYTQYSAREREAAWADERAQVPARRGKQGLGYGSAADKVAAGQYGQSDGSNRDRDRAVGDGNNSRGGINIKKGVAALDAATLVPGYECLSVTEKLKARMRLVMACADQRAAAAEAVNADEVSLARNNTAAVRAVGGHTGQQGGWGRFVLDKHGELDEDKQARQQFMDLEVGQAGFGQGGGSSGLQDAAAGAGAAFVMGTGRAAARRADTVKAADTAHEEAIFGSRFGGSIQGSGDWVNQQAAAVPGNKGVAEAVGAEQQDWRAGTGGGAVDSGQLTASLGVTDGVVAAQNSMSWRERAMALKARKQCAQH